MPTATIAVPKNNTTLPAQIAVMAIAESRFLGGDDGDGGNSDGEFNDESEALERAGSAAPPWALGSSLDTDGAYNRRTRFRQSSSGYNVVKFGLRWM
jgi:hypothetical protein